jgi:hypothetical protein
MNPLQLIATLRKFLYFLMGLFPLLSRLEQAVERLGVWSNRTLRKSARWRLFCIKLRKTAWYVALSKLIERFYWRDYGKDKLSLDELPGDSRVVLRYVFLVCAALCLLLPATFYNHPGVFVDAFYGRQAEVALWSCLLWFIAAAVGWSAFLTGLVFSNRLAFMAGGIAFAFLFCPIVTVAGKHFSNLFLPLVLLLGLYAQEKRLKASACWEGIGAGITNGVVGSLAGIYLLAAGNWQLGFPSLYLSLPLGAMLGIPLGWVARKGGAGEFSLSRLFFTNLSLIAINLAFLSMRSDLSGLASTFYSFAYQGASYLWPVWYFLSVGIIFKLLKSSKVLSGSLGELAGDRFLRPLLFLFLLFFALILFSEPLLVSLENMGGVFQYLWQAAAYVYLASKFWFWNQTVNSYAAPVFRVIVCFALALIAWLFFRRKYSHELACRIFYLTVLAWFLVSEYTFQLFSLARSTTHSVLVLFFFSIWLLWLLHTVGLNLSLKSTPAWPSLGRLPVYGGILIFCLLDIHCRVAMGEFKIMDELFLTMLRGLVDLGLPYFLYVWVSRRVNQLPLSGSIIFLAFCGGALFSLPLNALAKFAVCNFHWGAFLELITAQARTVSETGNSTLDMKLPVWWMFLRSVIYCSTLSGLLWWWQWQLKRRRFSRDETQEKEPQCLPGESVRASARNALLAQVLLLLGFASGLASFSKSNLELGLPTVIQVATWPFANEVFFTVHVFVTYFAFWLPALAIACCPSPLKLRAFLLFWLAPLLAAFALQWCYQAQEDFLRATNTLNSLIVLAGLVFLFSLERLVSSSKVEEGGVEPIAWGDDMGDSEKGDEVVEVDADLTAVEAEGDAATAFAENKNEEKHVPQPFVLAKNHSLSGELRKFAVLVSLALGMFSCLTLYRTQANQVELQAFKARLTLPCDFSRLPAALDGSNLRLTKAGQEEIFVNSGAGLARSYLHIGSLGSAGKDVKLLLKELLGEALETKSYPNFKILEIADWSRRYPGALACYFSFDLALGQGSRPAGQFLSGRQAELGKMGSTGIVNTVPMIGLVCLVPGQEQVRFITLYTGPGEIELRKWQVGWLVDQLAALK